MAVTPGEFAAMNPYSESSWNTFFQSRLQRAFENVGGIPQPSVTTFQVHTSYVA